MNAESKVSKQVSRFVRTYSGAWWNAKADFPQLENETDYWHKKNQEKEMNRFMDQFVEAIEGFPAQDDERKQWKQSVQGIIDDFAGNSDLVFKDDAEILLDDDLIQVTKDFVDEVKKFDKDISVENIGQAIRNVWIMNIIQLLCSKKIELTPSIFAYSMLYPYTDNYLDDNKISTEEKVRISNKFERRLAGDKIKPANNYEESLFRLVEKIEEQYDRSSCHEVFESLLSINSAQKKSLQQQGNSCGPYENDILGISMEKGGTSVLADAYLVNGNLTEQEASFFFGYGVLLQICDDLQDGLQDFKDHHMTIISQLHKKWYLDNVTNKLINFTNDLVDSMDMFDCENLNELKAIIRRNCIQLILFAVASNKNMYSKKYFSKIKACFPYTACYMNHMRNRIKRKYSNMKESYNGVQTDQIILYGLSKNAEAI